MVKAILKILSEFMNIVRQMNPNLNSINTATTPMTISMLRIWLIQLYMKSLVSTTQIKKKPKQIVNKSVCSTWLQLNIKKEIQELELQEDSVSERII